MFHFSGICCFCYVGDGKEIEKRREEKRREEKRREEKRRCLPKNLMLHFHKSYSPLKHTAFVISSFLNNIINFI